MNYALAKKLKDSGFPQKEWTHSSGIKPNEIKWYEPSLSELIESCGEPFFLETCPNWIAGKTRGMDGITGCVASIPEEAVANLWLVLNKEEVCPICSGTGEVTTMERVYPGEPHMAPIGTEKCECQLKDNDE